jgi:hypothetical protein
VTNVTPVKSSDISLSGGIVDDCEYKNTQLSVQITRHYLKKPVKHHNAFHKAIHGKHAPPRRIHHYPMDTMSYSIWCDWKVMPCCFSSFHFHHKIPVKMIERVEPFNKTITDAIIHSYYKELVSDKEPPWWWKELSCFSVEFYVERGIKKQFVHYEVDEECNGEMITVRYWLSVRKKCRCKLSVVESEIMDDKRIMHRISYDNHCTGVFIAMDSVLPREVANLIVDLHRKTKHSAIIGWSSPSHV